MIGSQASTLLSGTYIIRRAAESLSERMLMAIGNMGFQSAFKHAPVIAANDITQWDISLASHGNQLYTIRVPKQKNAYLDTDESKVFVKDSRSVYHIVPTGRGHYKIRIPTTQTVLKYSGFKNQITVAAEADGDPDQEWTFDLAKGCKADHYESYIKFFEQDTRIFNEVHIGPVYPRFGLKSKYSWANFWQEIANLNKEGNGTKYKVIFLGRHGEGVHNIGTKIHLLDWPIISRQNGDGILTWGPDAALTQTGFLQCQHVRSVWIQELAAGIGLPQISYSSPLTRCMVVNTITFSELGKGIPTPAKTTVVEDCREQCTQETPEKRQTMKYITEVFPAFSIEAGFTEDDEIWKADVSETSDELRGRARNVLDKIFSPDNANVTFVSITAHQGFVNAFVQVIGRLGYDLATGGVLPVVCKYKPVDY